MCQRFVSHRINLYTPEVLFSINCIALSPDKSKLAVLRRSLSPDSRSTGDDYQQLKSHSLVEIWEFNLELCLSLGQIIYEDEDEPCLLESIDWSHDGRLFACGLDGRLHLVDLINCNFNKWYPLVSGAGWCLAFDTSRTLVAVGTETGYICVFNVATQDGDGVDFEKNLNRDQARILCIAWYEPSKDERRLVSGSLGVIKIWNYESGSCLSAITVSNEPINIWSLLVLDNFIIVSGDSKGNTSFWDGNHATLINAVPSHKSDVLCLAKSANKKQAIYSSGVDPIVVSFSLDSNNRGIKSTDLHLHSHDVRSIVSYKDFLISGGFDCYLTRVSASPHRQIHQAPLFGHLIHVHRDKLLFQYHKSLEIWKIGSTKSTEIPLEAINGELLPLNVEPTKMVELSTRKMVHRSNFCDNWIAYSIYDKLKVLHYTEEAIQKIPLLLDPIFEVITGIEFIGCSHLLVSYGTIVNILKLASSGIVLEKSLPYKSRIHMMTTSNEYIAIAFGNLSIALIRTNDWMVHSRFKVNHLPTFMKFNSYKRECLWLGFANHQLLEYNAKTSEITKHAHNEPNPFLPLNGITFHPTGFIVYDQDKLYNCKGDHSWTVSDRYSHIAKVDFLPETKELLVIEVSRNMIKKRLPAAFAKKKFGT